MEDILDSSQYGFQANIGTTDVTFIVKMMLEKSCEWGISKVALFIDFEKVFDRVDRGNLWQILQGPHYDTPMKLVYKSNQKYV